MKLILSRILRVARPIKQIIAEEKHVIKEGERGGRYYLDDSGEKVYVHEDGTPKESTDKKALSDKYTKEEQKQLKEAIKSNDPEKAMELLKSKLPEDEYKKLEGLRKQYNDEMGDSGDRLKKLMEEQSDSDKKTEEKPDDESDKTHDEDEEGEEGEDEMEKLQKKKLAELEKTWIQKKEKARDAVTDAFSDIMKDLIGSDLSKIIFSK